MKKKKIAVCLFALSMLTGCAQREDTKSVVVPDKITLTIYYGTVHNTPMMNALTQDYEEETGIEVQWIPADDGTASLKKMIALDQTPDLFSVWQFDLAAWEPYLYDLSEEPWIEDVYETSLEAATVDGKVYAWPHVLEANGIVYNKSLFEQAGIRQVPTTLSELKVVCDTLESHGIRSFGESWMEFGYLAHMLAAPFMMEEDEESISQAIREGEKSFSDLKYIGNLFQFFDMTLSYGLGVESVAYNTLSQYPDFAKGEMAMMKQGTWVERDISQLADDYEIGIFPLPLSEDPEENKLHTTTTTFLSVYRNSGHLKETLDFVSWWHAHAGKYLAEIDGVVPPFYSVQENGQAGQLNRDMMRYLEEGKVYNGFGYEYWPLEFQQNMCGILQSYALGGADREETVQALDRLFRG